MDIMASYRNLGKPVYSYLHMRWVKGHQGRYLTYKKLSTQAKMNIQADELAEEYRELNQGQHRAQALSQPCTEPIPGQRVQLIINGYVVTQSHAKWIRYQTTGYDMRQYL
jgi:hypothetical protein